MRPIMTFRSGLKGAVQDQLCPEVRVLIQVAEQKADPVVHTVHEPRPCTD